MEQKYGLLKLGLVTNLKRNENGQNCVSFLSKLIGRDIKLTDINNFVESDDFNLEFIDDDRNITEKDSSTGFRFKLPWQDVKGYDVYGYFKKSGPTFIGVNWISNPGIKKYGIIDPTCWEKLKSICGIEITESNILEYITSDIEFYNGAGHPKFSDGTVVTSETGKFIKFSTRFSMNGEVLIGWFTKDIRGRFKGISWGIEDDFRSALKLREQFYVGRMVFNSIDECNTFLDDLKEATIPEPWEYKYKKDDTFKNPILKSYLEYELDRLFYEHESLKYPDRLIFNEDKNKVWFNTNLINKFGRDLTIVGTPIEILNKTYISELQINPSLKDKKDMKFDTSKTPEPPAFFKDLNEILFHCDWEPDLDDMKSLEHIIELRIDRFPPSYRVLAKDTIAKLLIDAIALARRIAQRNYKFIVPMYYPTQKRIQLLMPIYLGNAYSSNPDIALVLTPDPVNKMYALETILSLDDAYQDARLIAKPEESWLHSVTKSMEEKEK